VAHIPQNKDLDQSQCLDRVRDGSLSLTAVVEASALHSSPVYRRAEVRAWLDGEIAAYKNAKLDAVAGSQLGEADWYVSRDGDVFGPLSLAAISYLAQTGCMFDRDVCFSLKFQLRVPLEHLTGMRALQVEETNYYVNRKSKRVKTSFNATLNVDGTHQPVKTVNVSEGGVAVRTHLALKPQTRVQFLVTGFESVPEFIVDALVLSCRAVEGGFQLGLKFPALDKSQKQVLLAQGKKAG